MAKFFTLTCPSCGGSLKITSEVNRFACAHCGNEHIVKRGDGVVSLEPVVEGLSKIEKGVDKTASELAIPRLKKEIDDLKRNLEFETVQQIRSELKTIYNRQLRPNPFAKLPAKVIALNVYLTLMVRKLSERVNASTQEEIYNFIDHYITSLELKKMYTYFGGDSDSVNHKSLFHSRSEIKVAWAELHEMLSPILVTENALIKNKMEQLENHINIVNL